MALTGLTWSFGWYRTGFYKVFGVEVQQEGGAHGGVTRRGGKGGDQSGKNVSHSSSYVCWQQVYEQLALNNPGYKQITLSDGAANVSFNTFGNQRASDRYKFNPHSGKIDKVVLYKDAEKAGKIRGWIYSVHVGSWGGMLTRLLTFYSSFDRSHLAIDRILFMDKTYLEKESKSKLNIFVIRLGGEKNFII